jgi:hypothetical protein
MRSNSLSKSVIRTSDRSSCEALLTKLWPAAVWRRSFLLAIWHDPPSPWPVLRGRRPDHHADVDRPNLAFHGLVVAGRLIELAIQISHE